MEKNIKVHLSPLLKGKANFLIHAKCGGEGEEVFWEQIWAKQISESEFEVCCIPFFVYDLSIGDKVETQREGQFDYLIKGVVQCSGHITFRVWFGDSNSPSIRDEVIGEALSRGCLVEWHSANLLGISANSEETARQISGYLLELENAGSLSYETGKKEGD